MVNKLRPRTNDLLLLLSFLYQGCDTSTRQKCEWQENGQMLQFSHARERAQRV